jgi:uncharacterized protein YjbJ (UPF0337 family)
VLRFRVRIPEANCVSVGRPARDRRLTGRKPPSAKILPWNRRASTPLQETALATVAAPNRRTRMVNKDQVKGAAKQAKGSVKETAGKVTGSKSTQAEGKADKAAGKVQKGYGDAKEKVKKAL